MDLRFEGMSGLVIPLPSRFSFAGGRAPSTEFNDLFGGIEEEGGEVGNDLVNIQIW